jgi:uncharacterized membrane protein YhaH (DUF805 family)
VEFNTLLLPLGVIPALFILYVLIGDFEGRFKERHIFLTFVAGIIVGAVIYLMEGLTFYQVIIEYPNVVSFALLSLLFSFLEQLVKVAALNLRRFADAGLPLYGATFGMGFSATFATLLFRDKLEVTAENALLVLLPVAFLLVNAAAGVFVGTGIKRNLRLPYFLRAVAASAVMWLLVFFGVFAMVDGEYVAGSVMALVAFSLATAVFVLVYRDYLPYAMMDKRELRRL